MASYEDVNYSVRPAKAVQRKMMIDAIARLRGFARVSLYRYIGFGSPFFVDFSMLHRYLGITCMVNIEKCEQDEERFEFNKPFDFITMHFGDSENVLPSLKWDIRTVLWLDYDFRLRTSVLTDLSTFLASAVSGSMVIVTVDAKPLWKVLEKAKLEGATLSAMSILEEAVGADRIPLGVTEKDLCSKWRWETAVIYRRIMSAQIESQLNLRNQLLPTGSKMLYRQVFNFHYADGVEMLTIGGVVFDEALAKSYEACAFDELEFYRDADQPFHIEVPVLTHREVRHLNRFMPTEVPDEHLRAIPRGSVQSYKNLYRYFPFFAEIES